VKILVTGGSGYIGSHTVLSLLKNDLEVVILDNLSNSSLKSVERISSISKKDVDFEFGDVNDIDFLESLFAKHKFDFVIHFAALKAVGESCDKPLEYYKNNVSGLINLLSIMKSFGVKNFIFSSSCTVYGQPKFTPLNESHPTGTTFSPYGNTKYVCEEIIKDFSSSDPSFKYSILRYFNPIGADKSGLIGEDPKGIPNNLLPFICKVAIGSLDSLKIFGNNYPTKDGTAIRDYIHVTDLADAHTKSVFYLSNIKKNIICNLGTGTGYSVLDIVHCFERVTGVKIPYSFEARREGDITEVWADPSYAKKELGWSSSLTLKEMLSDSWNWQTKNPDGYL
jgi:UDP-glucose 4-epimerase